MTPTAEPNETPETPFRCSSAARWLPRTLAGAVLLGALISGQKIAVPARAAGMNLVAPAVALVGAILALAIVRKGGEVRLEVAVQSGFLRLGLGERHADLPFDRIESLGWASPFSGSRHWLPAAVAVDREGARWRLPGLLRNGDRLIAELIAASGRSDLQAWSETLGLERQMARSGPRIVIGYTVAAVLTAAAVVFYLT